MKLENETLSVKNASQFYKDLLKEIKENDEIVIDFENVKRIDLSIAQILISANRYVRENRKSMKLKSLSEDTKRLMNLCGIRV